MKPKKAKQRDLIRYKYWPICVMVIVSAAVAIVASAPAAKMYFELVSQIVPWLLAAKIR